MINYLAEQMELADDGSCVQAKKNCFETILQLWENHSVFPDGARPFEQFEPIFKTLDSLSPENAIPRYFTNQEFEPSEELNSSYTWLEAARKLDSAARTLITFIFDQAIDNAITDDTKDWIKTLSGTVDVNTVNFIVRYAGEKEPNKTQERIEKLNNRVKQLKMFESLSKSILQDLELELEALNEGESRGQGC
ncbi:MAG: hypothetical protein ACJAS1_004902 [Oleiphilaceae bacterium]|jgi:hypothetical protein